MHALNSKPSYGLYRGLQIITVKELVCKSQNKILNFLDDYGINEKSLQGDIKKIVLHCCFETIIDLLKTSTTTLIVDNGPFNNESIANIIGDSKADKCLDQLKKALQKIFKTKYIAYEGEISLNDIPGEIIERLQINKKFNFKILIEFFDSLSLSGLKRKVNDNLSVRCSLSTSFSK